MDVRERLTDFVRALPAAHRVMIASCLVGVAMLAVLFGRWVTTPTYTILYTGLDDQAVAAVVDGLESEGVPYRLEAGGSRVLVPRERLYTTRAALAAAGVGAATRPQGYELLDDQGLSVSDFRQRVDYQRALEGELARTLAAMGGVDQATVHLVIPRDELFADRQKPVTASVLLSTRRTLSESEIETVTFLVASSVEGLEVDNVTVADTDGTVLHAPGSLGGQSVATNRNLRQTREFEQALAADIGAMLQRITGDDRASVVVRADLDFDERETQSERYGPDTQVALREQTTVERFEGTGMQPGGAVGVDGGPLVVDGNDSAYERDEALREFGVDKVVDRTVTAPGRVEGLSVAIVMDDGTLTGAQVPPDAEIEQLVAAAVRLDAERGDTIAVSTVAFPAPVDEEPAPEARPAWLDLAPQGAAVLVLLIICVALFVMTRRRQQPAEELRWEEEPEPVPAVEQGETVGEVEEHGALHAGVAELVQRQPEEIAVLLRSWLADRRS